MPDRHPFHLNRSGVLLALISAAFAGQAGAAAGRVDFTVGGATVSGTDGKERPLAKGAELDSGDTVRTNNGRAQIRFTDGAYVSLQPNTDFSIKEYNYDGKTDGSERGFFGLAKGAMRAVTGLIGRVNRSRYAITTPTATVGIRGTGGLIAINNDGSTTITGTSGIWTLTNPVGTLDVPAGTVGTSPANPDQPPKQTDQPPSVGPTQPTQPPTFTQGDQRAANGDPLLGNTLPPLVSGSGFAVGAAFSSSAIESSAALVIPGVDATFDSVGRLTSFAFPGGGPAATLLDPVNGHAEANNMDGLAWGRWIGRVMNCPTSFCATDTYSADEGYHYVVGTPTVTMPIGGGGTYNLLGATSPTYVNGNTAPGTFKGTLDIAFTPTGANIGMNLNVTMPDSHNYAIGGSLATGSGPIFSGSAFNSFGTQTTPLTIVAGAGAAPGTCTCGCGALVSGFFSGTTAERVGLSYMVTDVVTPSAIVGAAAFKKP